MLHVPMSEGLSRVKSGGESWKEAESGFETNRLRNQNDAEWTVPWESPHGLGNAQTVGAQTRSGSKIKIT